MTTFLQALRKGLFNKAHRIYYWKNIHVDRKEMTILVREIKYCWPIIIDILEKQKFIDYPMKELFILSFQSETYWPICHRIYTKYKMTMNDKFCQQIWPIVDRRCDDFLAILLQYSASFPNDIVTNVFRHRQWKSLAIILDRFNYNFATIPEDILLNVCHAPTDSAVKVLSKINVTKRYFRHICCTNFDLFSQYVSKFTIDLEDFRYLIDHHVFEMSVYANHVIQTYFINRTIKSLDDLNKILYHIAEKGLINTFDNFLENPLILHNFNSQTYTNLYHNNIIWNFTRNTYAKAMPYKHALLSTLTENTDAKCFDYVEAIKDCSDIEDLGVIINIVLPYVSHLNPNKLYKDYKTKLSHL